jgi:hypothetical protein
VATKRTAGLLVALVVTAALGVAALTTCEGPVDSAPESAVAPVVAADLPSMKPVAPRRARAAKDETTREEFDAERDVGRADAPVETGPFVVVPVDVVDAETGRPIEGASLDGNALRRALIGTNDVDGVTDANGHAEVHLSPAALHEMTTRAPGHAASIDYVRTQPIGAAQPTLRIELAPGGSLRGVVRDPDGKPVEGARVDLRRSDVDDVLQSAPSGADGAYVIEGLAFGAKYTARTEGDRTVADYCPSADSASLVATREHPVVVADLRLRRSGTIDLTVLDGDEPIDESLRIKLKVLGDGGVWTVTGVSDLMHASPGRHTITVTFDDRAPSTETVDVPEGGTVTRTVHLTRGATISGLVVDDAGAPVEDVWIRDAAATGDTREHRADTRSRADGSFELALLAAGEHALSVSAPFEYEDIVVPPVWAPSENVRLVLPRRGVLKLRTVFDGDAKPAPSARIAFHGTLDGKPWDIDRWLPADGRFEIAWPAGVCGDIGIAVEGSVPVMRNVTVPPGAIVDLGEIRMHPECVLNAVLLDDDGAPRNQATVVVHGAMGDRRCRTLEHGRFAFRGLAAGTMRIDLADPPHASFLVDVPAAKDVVLVVPRSGLLQVFASNPSGQRLVARKVDVIDGDGVNVDSGTTDANGSWTDTLVPGRYSVRVEGGPHGDAEVRADDVTVLRLR